ncbi:FtsK/SpoIIIE domain-containing protein [Kingella kingae]|uniref:FtsK/SpoIIIE domain-containing protein n=1 Tax=Kingella kingae TaxID=504 RepID=UPI000415A7D3|nr:FtsK/SpoIIIE domain-containing protein [Kingella kingae]
MSYQVNTATGWDTEWFHELMKPRIKGSLKSQEVRKELANQGALPAFDNNYDWAMFCIAYCFAKDLIPHLETAPDAKGSEIPNFETCFQKEARLWLAYLSDALFELKQGKPCTRDDLYQFIQDLWHTGAVELEKRWYAYRQNNEHSELDAQKQFLEELAKLAQKHSNSRKRTAPSSLQNNDHSDHENSIVLDAEIVKKALERAKLAAEKVKLIANGLRYDCFRVQLKQASDLDSNESKQKTLRSELNIADHDLRVERNTSCGTLYTFDLKILRPRKEWRDFGKAEFQAALTQFQHKNEKLPVCIGIDEAGNAQFADLTDAPHCVVAGETKSGKSVFIRALLHSLCQLNSEKDVQLYILDPKRVDYQEFKRYPHLVGGNVITEIDEMVQTLHDLVDEMEERYSLLEAHRKNKVSDLADHARPPYCVVLVEEAGDLFDADKSAEEPLVRLVQKARAAGIHLIVATQRPDSATLSGRLRDNLNSKVALRVGKHQSSNIILGESGAEGLAGYGDHLIKWDGSETRFLHGYNI